MTSTALMFYSVGMLALAFCELLNKSFFAMHDSKTPMKTSLLGMVCNMVLSVTLSRLMGFGGLALATALSSVANALALLYCMKKRQGSIFSGNDFRNFGKIIAADVLMAAGILQLSSVMSGLPYGKITVPVLSAMAGAAIYLAACGLLRVSELQTVLALFRKKKGEGYESE